jgi:hypothetical protein
LADGDIARGQLAANQTWIGAVRIIAPRYGVDADDLLRKARFKLPEGNELTEAEGTVCMLACKMAAEVIWDTIKIRFPNLPELREREENKE